LRLVVFLSCDMVWQQFDLWASRKSA